MDQRARIPVSLPHENPTTSYWHIPEADLAHHRTTSDLPKTADYVVVGSGISGALIAYNLLTQHPNAQVVILEARTACGGATGRNGGHTKAASYRSFIHNSRKLGIQEATLIAKLERSNLVATHEFARDHSIDCDSNPCPTVDVMYSQEHWDAGVAGVEKMRKIFGTGPSEQTGVDSYTIHSPEDTASKFLCPDALGSLEFDAGSISGYKFAIGVLRLGLQKGLNLQTDTPALSIKPADSSFSAQMNGASNGPANGPAGAGAPRWTIETGRGSIATPNIILATNGYTASLLPEVFQGRIVPLRGQVSAQRPGSNLPNGGSLPTTYSFIYDAGYEYMITRPPGTLNAGDIVVGGGFARALPNEGMNEFGETDDTITQAKVSDYLTWCCAEGFFGKKNWGDDAKEGRVRQEWTGIMGFSADGLPYVGEVPGMKGCWVSASFEGHGMVLCLKSAEALTAMLLGHDDESLDAWFPKSFRITETRLKVPFEGRQNAKPPKEPQAG